MRPVPDAPRSRYAVAMTQPHRVIYLPPGVVPPEPAGAPEPTEQPPFDREFFETVLPQAVASFCQQVGCEAPRVEVYTTDGTVHYVHGISGVADAWVALYASREDHQHPLQLFVPYGTVFRVEIHPESDEASRRLGFVAPIEATTPPAVQPRRPEARVDGWAGLPEKGRTKKNR